MVVRVFAAASAGDRLEALAKDLRSHPEVEVVGIGSTGNKTVEVLRTEPVDTCVFSETLADLARAIRLSTGIPLNGSPAMVVAADSISDARLVTSLAYGFDSILPVAAGPDAAARRLVEIANGQHRLSNEIPVDSLAPGLLARRLVADDPIDRQIADLVGSGLDDGEISRVTGRSIQDVRNRIESIIDANSLSTRTHLAIMRAAQIVVPDFA